ncbi:Zinc-binding oxidoreductase [Penicillium soppii]|uniref:Zinc-binding oxidoreductase n=1 Tax=Penicillium soppii TaxID=69789 RepID=UPI0025482A3D|nr:Zinc-binding oxidoreductase [Penicillium soppii]KAJ5864574.1 Zinc-binding oxidoreductase [Penicillium soppii]
MPPTNEAAWLVAPGHRPLEVKPAPYTPPGPKQIVLKNAAVAINPMDWAKQFVGDKKWEWIKHPWILGEDVAGEVFEIGDEVTRFKIGDRVIAHAVGFYAYGNRAEEAAFQLYTIVREHMASPIPDFLSFREACVIPMACSAASCALYQRHLLALEYPKFPAARPNGLFLLITGGATSVGNNAIQLARASGYGVVTTCSPRNFPRVRELGALYTVDYNSPTLEEEIVALLKEKAVAGAFAIGPGSVVLCIHVLDQLGEGCRKVVAKASFPWPKEDPQNDAEYWRYMKWVDGWNKTIRKMGDKVGVETKFVEGAELGRNEIGKAIYENFLSGALAGGGYFAAPIAQVGVSATKIVVTLKQKETQEYNLVALRDEMRYIIPYLKQ